MQEGPEVGLAWPQRSHLGSSRQAGGSACTWDWSGLIGEGRGPNWVMRRCVQLFLLMSFSAILIVFQTEGSPSSPGSAPLPFHVWLPAVGCTSPLRFAVGRHGGSTVLQSHRSD